MTWLLILHDRVIARGSRSTVIDAGEERGLLRIDTLGHDTAQPVPMPRVMQRGVRVAVVAS